MPRWSCFQHGGSGLNFPYPSRTGNAVSARFSGPSAFGLTGVKTVSQSCHISGMAKHPNRPRDPAQLAKLIVDIATGAVQDEAESDKGPMSALGRFGGLKGGRARADKLSSFIGARKPAAIVSTPTSRFSTSSGTSPGIPPFPPCCHQLPRIAR